MKGFYRLIACVGLMAALFAAPAQAGQAAVPVIEGPTYVMTYVEVIPSAIPQALAALREYRDASRREPGANFVDILQEEGQSHRFVVNEIWQNRAAVQAHSNSAAATALMGKVKGMELGPLHVTIHQAHAVTPPKGPSGNNVIVVSHVDVAGGNTQNLMNAFRPLSEASVKESGMVRYEILDEVPAHANHFRLLEEWSNLAAFEAHNRAAHTQTYRQTILPWLGTPYDQRLYRVVP